jgi:hypothetical protein
MSNTKKQSFEETEKQNPAKAKKIVLISGANYHDFEQEPIFEGQFIKNVESEKDGKLLGFLFVSQDGEEKIVSSSYAVFKAIQKSVELGIDKPYLIIEFKGKEIIKKTGLPFNRFNIQLLQE